MLPTSFDFRVGKKTLWNLIQSSIKVDILLDGVVQTFSTCFHEVCGTDDTFKMVNFIYIISPGTKGNVFTHTYSSESEQFTGHDAYKLDEWVFERFERFIKVAPHNSTLETMLKENHLIFFFHLLGLDTNGHTNKPHSS